MSDNFETSTDVVNIYIWLSDNEHFDGKPMFRMYVIFVMTVTLFIQVFSAAYILYLVDFLQGVWGVYVGFTTDKDKNKALICKEFLIIDWIMICLLCQIFFSTLDEKIILYMCKKRRAICKKILFI